MFKRRLRSPISLFMLGGMSLLIIVGALLLDISAKGVSYKPLSFSESNPKMVVHVLSQCMQQRTCSKHVPTSVPTQIARSTPTKAVSTPTQTVATSAPNPASGTRDPAYWPYSSDSPWNMPIGSGAQFAPATSSKWTSIQNVGFVMTYAPDNSIPVYVAKLSDPIRKIYRTNGGSNEYVVFTMHVPDAAVPATGGSGDHWLELIDETHSYVIEMFQAVKRSDGDIEAGFPNKIDLRSSGISPDRYEGSCAYGGSCIAGLIRKGEISDGIRHALRMSLAPQVLNQFAPNGKSYVWPAGSSDSNAASTYSTAGNVYMGTLLAIPPDVDIEKIAGPPGTPLYELAWTLQNYGAYVVDSGYFNLYGEVGTENELKSLQYNTALTKYLQVVTNNGPNSVGGGGTSRQPLAPPFA